MGENFFSDDGIMEQTTAIIKKKDGTTTNGISLILNEDNPEILLEYDELKAALADLEADRVAMPHLYIPSNNVPVLSVKEADLLAKVKRAINDGADPFYDHEETDFTIDEVLDSINKEINKIGKLV